MPKSTTVERTQLTAPSDPVDAATGDARRETPGRLVRRTRRSVVRCSPDRAQTVDRFIQRGGTLADSSRAVQELERPATGEWEIDQVHSHIGFVSRHVAVTKVRGRFTEYSGHVHIDDVPEKSTVDVTIQAASITTDSAQRDAHLRSPDFLDVERYAVLSFRSTVVEVTSNATARVTGALTIKDVTRPVTLDVTYEGAQVDPWGGIRAGFTAAAEIDREDFGITWNRVAEAGSLLVGRKVRIELDVELVETATAVSPTSFQAAS